MSRKIKTHGSPYIFACSVQRAKSVSKDSGFVDHGHTCLFISGRKRVITPHAMIPLLWQSGGQSPGRAAGTEGLQVSPPRRSQCGSTRLFWRWRRLLGEQPLSVEWFLIKKKEVSINHMTKKITLTLSWMGQLYGFETKNIKSMRKCRDGWTGKCRV